jgi:phage baseplate assembly protein W
MTIPFSRPARLYKDIDLSFGAHPVTGDVLKVLDVNAAKQALKTLLFTQFGERPFQPKLSSPLYRLQFEQNDPITLEVLKQTIERLIQNYDARILLDKVDVVPDGLNAVEITVFFHVVGIPVPASFSTTLTRLR